MANIELDGPNKKIKVDSGDLTLDVPGDIVLDADGGDVVFADGGTNLLKVTNSSSDVVLQPQVDAKDIVFKQYDGTVVATVEDNATFNIPASKLAIGGTAVTSTAAELNILDGVTATATELNLIDGVTATTAELNILDGVTSTAAELNIVDGNTSATSTTLADADRVVVNDAGTMKQVAMTDVKTYMGGGRSTLLATTTLSSAASQFDMTDVITDTYNNYLLVWHNGTVATDGTDIRITFFAGSGTSSHIAGGDDYRVVNHQLISDGTDNSDTNTTDAFYRPNKSGMGNASDECFNGTMMLFNARSTSKSTLIHSELSYASSSGHPIGTRSHGMIKPTNAVTGLRFEVASGNMNSGTWKLYGME